MFNHGLRHRTTAAKESKMKSKKGKTITDVDITIDLDKKTVTTQAVAGSDKIFDAVEATL